MVGVSVGGSVFVGIDVKVGVGVSVAKRVLSGLPGPASQTISRINPPSTNTTAMIEIVFGFRRCRRLRYELITSDDDEEMGGLFMNWFLLTKARFACLYPSCAM